MLAFCPSDDRSTTVCHHIRFPSPRSTMSRHAAGFWLCRLCLSSLLLLVASQPCEVGQGGPQLWGYEVVAEFPHDSAAYTQGLQHDSICNPQGSCSEVFWESTGGLCSCSGGMGRRINSGVSCRWHTIHVHACTLKCMHVQSHWQKLLFRRYILYVHPRYTQINPCITISLVLIPHSKVSCLWKCMTASQAE